MNWVLALLAAQAVTVPAYSPPDALPPADPAKLSLVVVMTVSETDPQPLCDRPNCTSLFLGRYSEAVTLAGLPIARDFTARVEMGSPWARPYRLVMIVEERPAQEPLVRAMTGFDQQTAEGCFAATEIEELGWTPEGPAIKRSGGDICVSEAAISGR